MKNRIYHRAARLLVHYRWYHAQPSAEIRGQLSPVWVTSQSGDADFQLTLVGTCVLCVLFDNTFSQRSCAYRKQMHD